MTMKRSRLFSALLALLTILCGAALKLFPPGAAQQSASTEPGAGARAFTAR